MKSLYFGDNDANSSCNNLHDNLAVFDRIVKSYNWKLIKAKLIDDALVVCVVYDASKTAYILLSFDISTIQENVSPKYCQYFDQYLCNPRKFAIEVLNKFIDVYIAYGCFIVDLTKG